VLYERRNDDLFIVEPKAHGLGYLYPPKADDEGCPWHADAWEWLLRSILKLAPTKPAWFARPALMRVVLSTPHVLRRLRLPVRPFNFLFYVLVDGVVGLPRGVDPQHFTVIAPFSKRRGEWMNLRCLNIYDGRGYSLGLAQTPALDKIIPQTFATLLGR